MNDDLPLPPSPASQPAPGAAADRNARNDRKETVIVTGSSGFLGRALIDRLGARYELVGLDFALPTNPTPSFEAVRVDLTSEASVEAAIARVRAGRGARIASVIHLAGYYDLSGDPSPKYDEVTVRGTERLLAALQPLEVEQFVFASTMLVHAPTSPGKPIDEASPIRPKTPYPESKMKTERLIAGARGNIPAVILRLAGVYDERGHAAFLAQQAANIFERQLESYVYPGDPGTGQPYLHIEDLIDAIERLIARRRELPPEVTLLLGEPETLSYDELQRRIGCSLHGEEWETRRIPKPLAKVGQWLQEDLLDLDPFVQPWMIDQASDHYELDISRARRLIGWEPAHSLAATLPAMMQALKADPPGWYAANKLNAAKVAAADSVLEKAGGATDRPSADAIRAVERELERQHAATLWAHLANLALGAWLIAGPFAYGLFDPVPNATPPPAAGRALAEPALRNAWLGWSEMASGALILLFSGMAMARTRYWAQWAMAALGIWILFAPIVFWTTSPAAYAVDTLVGMLVIVLAVMIPPQPGIDRAALASSGDLPLGWSYSPSTAVQRVPIVALAFVGLFVSRYLAAYQLGHVDGLWDPFFGGVGGAANGSESVVTSSLSKAFPIADAGFGAIAYALDILTGAMGDRRRWRTMPWLVLIFGLLIIPLGMVSVGFIMIQPTLIGALCTLCIIQAAITVYLIPYSADEVVATLQFLIQSRKAGASVWRVLLKGAGAFDRRQDRAPGIDAPLGEVARGFLRGGVTYPWTLLASLLVGAYLMASPLLLGTEPPPAHVDHVAGCLVITVAAAALAEVLRAARFINVAIGLGIAAAPFLLGEPNLAATVSDLAAGAALVLLSLPRGKLSQEHYGGWDRFIV